MRQHNQTKLATRNALSTNYGALTLLYAPKHAKPSTARVCRALHLKLLYNYPTDGRIRPVEPCYILHKQDICNMRTACRFKVFDVDNEASDGLLLAPKPLLRSVPV